jgi:hypothetical protein
MMRADPAERFEHFCELLSLDISLPQIRERLGVTKGCTGAMMRKLRNKYGWQAQ